MIFADCGDNSPQSPPSQLLSGNLTSSFSMSGQSRPRQHSATSLARFNSTTQPEVDVFNGSKSRDYCNSFWGPGDAGPNIMFTRMRGASKTTDELRNFWNERCVPYWVVFQSLFLIALADATLRRNMLPV